MPRIFDNIEADLLPALRGALGLAERSDELDASASKPVLDEIDHVLAQQYGLTEEELDFIANYDIKYRMGVDREEPAV
jgi:hypothetical protein